MLHKILVVIRALSTQIWIVAALFWGCTESLEAQSKVPALASVAEVRSGWQGLPKQYQQSSDWKPVGHGPKGMWFYLREASNYRLEYRDLRHQVLQSVRLPDYLERSTGCRLSYQNERPVLFFDLFNSETGDHGMFKAGISTDSNRAEPPVLVAESRGHDPRDLLEFEWLDRDSLNQTWLVHRSLGKTTLRLHGTLLDQGDQRLDSFSLVVPQEAWSVDASTGLFELQDFHALKKVGQATAAMLVTLKERRKSRNPVTWGLLVLDLRTKTFATLTLNTPDREAQALALGCGPEHKDLLVYGLALGKPQETPSKTLCYRVTKTPEGSLQASCAARILDPEASSLLAQFNSDLRNMTVQYGYFLELHLDSLQGASLAWRRRLRTSETMVQYSQGMPVYREIIRYHAREWLLTRIQADGLATWSQVLPMQITQSESNSSLLSTSMVLGSTWILGGYQTSNLRTQPFMFRIQPDGTVWNGDLHGGLKDLQIRWTQAFALDHNNAVIPTRKRSREGLLYLHHLFP